VFPFRSQWIVLLVIFAGAWDFKVLLRIPSGQQAAPPARVRTGIDVYESMNSEPFAGKRLGLITNQTGVDSQGRRTIDVLASRMDVKLVALFSPEHGIFGTSEDRSIRDSADRATELPVYSLYGETRQPTDEMLKNIDVLVFDMQDAGVRFYTYVTTMAYCMEAAAKHHIQFVVMDRPDPLGGDVLEGPMLDSDRRSFAAYFPMPIRYAMTIAELAKMFNAENHIGADLQIFPLRNWNRHEAYDETGLTWIAPSPNLHTVMQTFLYPGLEVLQAGDVSVGRGTEGPFEILGAPWIHALEFASELGRRQIPGVEFTPVQFIPNQDPHRGKTCEGVTIRIRDRGLFRSIRTGLEIADVLHRMYPERFQLERIVALLGSQSSIDRLKRGDRPTDIISGWAADLDKFRRLREKYLLYD